MATLHKKAGVIGWPVSHSLSPKLHSYWLKKYGIDGEYVPLPIQPDKLEEGLQRLIDEAYVGANLTVPHKELVLAYVDEIDALAQAVGAVNTLVFRSGKIIGSNSDVVGFSNNISPFIVGKQKAVVVGAGGAARAVIVALKQLGFENIVICNRSEDKAHILAQQHHAEVVTWDKKHLVLRDADLLVNTTSLGMQNQPALELSLEYLPTDALVTDIVYTPLITPLLAAARARGNPTVDGLGMLLYQAAPGFEAWFGVKPEVTEALRNHMLAL